MEQIVLEAKKRKVRGKKVKQLRQEGWVPAVLYGNNIESIALQVETKQAHAAVAQAGTSQLITVKVGKQDPVNAIIRDLQQDPIRRNVLHIDFYQVDMTQVITSEIPLAFVGEPLPVGQALGILVQGMDTLEVECLPGDLVDAIEVDLSALVEINEQLTIGDLAVPSTIRVLTDLDEMVARVIPMPEEEEEIIEVDELLEGEPELIAREEGEEDEGEEEESEEE